MFYIIFQPSSKGTPDTTNSLKTDGFFPDKESREVGLTEKKKYEDYCYTKVNHLWMYYYVLSLTVYISRVAFKLQQMFWTSLMKLSTHVMIFTSLHVEALLTKLSSRMTGQR